MKPKVLEEKCTACKVCIPFCPEATIELMNIKEIGGKAPAEIRKIVEIDYEFCKGCGVCSDVCPERAIIMGKNNGKEK